MKSLIKVSLIFVIIMLNVACMPDGLTEQANKKFGDQNFQTAISLIEMHKIRNGSYPVILDSIKYYGDWDAMAISSVKYVKVGEGYNLDLVNGWIGKPQELSYPDDFWQGLGLIKSNLKLESQK